MGAMALRNSNSARFTSVWSLVLILLIIAFWRTMAPERSARVVKRLVAQQHQSQLQLQNEREIQDERDELASIKASIEREQGVLMKLRTEIEILKESREYMVSEGDTDNDIDGIGPGPISVSKKVKKITQDNDDDDEEESTSTSISSSTVEDELDELDELDAATAVDEKDPYPEDCNLVLAPISAEAGLGIQTEHLWKHLTIAKALNACVALPPIVAKTTAALRYVPFHEVIDLDSLIIDGEIRAVPLNACKKRGVTAIYSDDANANFPHYVKKADPALAISSDYLQSNSVKEVKQFENGKFEEDEGTCIGMGRMGADIITDDTVVSAWKANPKIAEYVSNRYPNLGEDTLFVKLRKVCTTEGDIYLGDASKQVVLVQDWVNAVKQEALRTEVSNIYVSIPATTREDTLEYLSENLKTVDNVVLNLEGDEFAAKLVEGEIATLAKAFVSDWGIWGDTITKIRKARYQGGDTEVEEITNADIMQRWMEAGSPDHSAIYTPQEMEEPQEEEPEQYEPPTHEEEESDVYVPPQQEEEEEPEDAVSSELQDSEKQVVEEVVEDVDSTELQDSEKQVAEEIVEADVAVGSYELQDSEKQVEEEIVDVTSNELQDSEKVLSEGNIGNEEEVEVAVAPPKEMKGAEPSTRLEEAQEVTAAEDAR